MPGSSKNPENGPATVTPQSTLRAKCARCGHGYSFHGKATDVECKAMGCMGGQDGERCPGFVPAEEAPSFPPTESLSSRA